MPRRGNGPGHGGPARGTGTRPPFEANNTMAQKHGGQSPRQVVPRADALVAALLEHDGTPEYLRWPLYAASVASWARLEAKVQLIGEWLENMPVEDQVIPQKGATKPPVEIWLLAEKTAAQARQRLGLDPVSHARLIRDLGLESAAAEDAIRQLSEQGRVLRVRRELEEGGPS